MGCDGYLHNLDKPLELYLTCYTCGGMIYPKHPRVGHEKCVDERNGDEILRVNIVDEDLELR